MNEGLNEMTIIRNTGGGLRDTGCYYFDEENAGVLLRVYRT